ncbi:TP901 family phage tail tape measure protein [Neorhizobium galegae bv. officinalis]|nr:TP901 family phage tail tape measure protein [Neorhizobium galegae bv. officinalis]
MATLQSTLRVSLLDDVTKRAKAITGALRGLQQQSSAWVSPFRSLTAQAVAFGGAYLGVTSGFSSTYQAAADTQAALTEVGIKASLSQTELGQLQRRLTELAPRVNQTSTELLAGVDAMLTMGASARDAEGAIPAVGKTATATGAAIADLSSASVSAMQNLNVMPSQIQKMLEGMTSAGNAGAFEMKDMAQYFPQLTASAKTLGMQGVPAVNDMAAALQIARRGAGDASTAANNLSDFMGKIMTPQTIKNFKKFGVDVTKELDKAHKKGISPIEHFIGLIDDKTKGGRGELLTQIFGDKQTLDFVRPMIAGFQDYLRIRGEADRANGVVADAYNRRMGDANQKVKSFQIGIQNLGTSIGNNLLKPVGDAAGYLADVLNTLDSRITVFDRVKFAAQGFISGLGFKDGELSTIAKDWREFIFGVEDGSKAADQAGLIFKRFRDWGDDIRYFTTSITDNPIGRFLGDIAPYGLQIAAWSVGIGWLAGAVRKLASALFFLSGASALVSAFKLAKGLAGILGVGGGAAAGAAGGAAASAAGGAAASTVAKGGLLARLAKMGIWGMAGMGAWDAAKASYTGDTPYKQGKTVLPDFTDLLHLLGSKASSTLSTDGGPGFQEGMKAENDRFLSSWLEQHGGGAPKYGTTDTLAGKSADDAVRIDASSIAAMVQPTGTQDVRVTNPQPPNITIHAPISISGVVDPQAAAAAAVSKLGETTKAAVEAADTD